MAQSKKKTIHSSGDIGKVIGGPRDLPVSDIPTLKDVLAKGLNIQDLIGKDSSAKNFKHDNLVNDLYQSVNSQYKKVNSALPEKSLKGVEKVQGLRQKWHNNQ